MPKRLATCLSLALSATMLVVACSSDQSPLAPAVPVAAPVTAPLAAPVASSGSLLGGLLGGLVGTVDTLLNILVGVVDRVVPLSSDVTWSFVAGPAGARSSNSAVGLSIVVPPAALSQNVTITVTARKGSAIDYHFEPEGLQFAVPVVLTQTVSSSYLYNSSTTIKGAYYSSSTLQYDASTGQAIVNEFEPTVINRWQSTVSFSIKHFSGYIVASDNSSGSSSWGW
ncbi:MAG TPA: hypothetical protein VJU87_08770 [Gemmatimonadaceae bacterium]|nr:hypothetical protein [Gemmatimonadaceae bacterium]